jgi:hypothetical protein
LASVHFRQDFSVSASIHATIITHQKTNAIPFLKIFVETLWIFCGKEFLGFHAKSFGILKYLCI